MITASIVVFNTSVHDLNRLFKSVLLSNIDYIYLIDNSPIDNLKVEISIYDKIEYIFGHGNIGYGSGHNIGINKGIQRGSQYHVILNPDIYFDNGTIEKIHGYAIQNKSTGLLMPKILYPSGDTQYLCKLLPNPFDLLIRRFLPFKTYVNKQNNIYELRFTDYDSVMEVPSLSGCFMFIRTDVLKQIGGFDERFFMYAEDLDICRRIGELSQTVYYPLVSVYHEYAKESYKNKKLLKYHIQSIIRYFNKWGWVFDKKRTIINKKFLLKYKI